MKAIGIDFGVRNIGIAITYHGDTATPLSVIPGKPLENAVSMIEQIVTENDIELVVLGIPYSLSGGKSAQTKEVLRFEDILKKRLDTRVVTIDERLTTRQAENLLLQYGAKKGKLKVEIDKYSAALILQSYLESTGNAGG